ncbi:HNH endonuclease family protein [Arcanobacterium ihumii]|uniref:HNH endonuclease family protein n=1 Tax=Arcanobacterium ihumii TaxID=2138162 RepID=UPI000F51BD85|nr:HNH endonuclease family protein [Arcanobacterium ihumii]
MKRKLLASVTTLLTFVACTPAMGLTDSPAVQSQITIEAARSTNLNKATTIDSESAEAELDKLPVKGRAPKTGYSRKQFGPAWADTDHNGCDTRNDILQRDLTNIKTKANGCTVLSGTLVSPYTGETIEFVRGNLTSSLVPIDHVVALSDAWQKGAQQISAEDRKELANDPLNLIAVDERSNKQKSDADAASWLPSNKSFRCEYVTRQIQVKTKYQLWVTSPEKTAMKDVLATCPR